MEQNRSVSPVLIFGILGPLLLVLGTYYPLVGTTLGASYGVGNVVAMRIYIIAVAVFALNVVSDKANTAVVRQLHLVAIAVTFGCLIYGAKLSSQGWDWLARQIAYEAPAAKQTNQSAYWKKLEELVGPDKFDLGSWANLLGVGTLRTAYEAYGPRVQMDDVAIFERAVFDLTPRQAQDLTKAAGISYLRVPLGIVGYVASLAMQIAIVLLLRRCSQPASS